MRRFSDRHHLSTLSELNITPLLDLAFVLLIIFMITTPLLDNSLDLVAPTSNVASTQIDPAKVRTVSIDRFEALKLDEEPVTLEQLAATMAAGHEAGSTSAVIVRPHRDLPVQKLVSVMDVLQRAGITQVGLATQPEKQSGKE